MKIIVELMEVYADHIGLPLSLVNLSGEVDFKVDLNGKGLLNSELTANLLDLKNIAMQLKKPTVVSLSTPKNVDIYYIVTPDFPVSDSNYFVVAGPFIFKNRMLVDENHEKVIVFSEDEIEEKNNKIHNLFEILVMKDRHRAEKAMPKKIVSVLQALGDFEEEIVDYHAYIRSILDELVKMGSIDFLGLAVKNGNDMFDINYIIGEKESILLGESFYMGEGLLGKIAILGRDFLWNEKIDLQRNDFFHRFGIYPQQLFGVAVKQQNEVQAVIFGGSYKQEEITSSLLNLIKCISVFISQKKEITQKMADANYMKLIFANWIDVMDILQILKDEKQIAYKLIDFCQTINEQYFSCFTTVDHEFNYRGEYADEIIQQHRVKVVEAMQDLSQKRWLENNCIHFALDFYGQRYGLCTVKFLQQEKMLQAEIMLAVIDQLLQSKVNSSNQIINTSADSIFHLLHTSMEQMNPKQYQLSIDAVNTMGRLIDVLDISEEKKESLQNLCSVLPFDLGYLEKNIAHTKEWQYIKRMLTIIEEPDDEADQECKILAFIYKVIIQKKSVYMLDFLSTSLKEICLTTYENERKANDMYKLTLTNDVERKHRQEIHDLKEVIAKFTLTSREQEILFLIIEGLNNHEVGQYLNISVHTVKNHVTNIFKKLNVSDRMQAMAKIYRIKYEES